MNNQRVISCIYIIMCMLFSSGCVQHIKWMFDNNLKDFRVEQRMDIPAERSLGKMEWREFPVYRMYLPCWLDICYCCYQRQLRIMLPDTEFLVNSLESDVASSSLKLLSVASSDFNWRMTTRDVIVLRAKIEYLKGNDVAWYMTKRYSDRLLLLVCRKSRHKELNDSIELICEFDDCRSIAFSEIEICDSNKDEMVDLIWQLGRLVKVDFLN